MGLAMNDLHEQTKIHRILKPASISLLTLIGLPKPIQPISAEQAELTQIDVQEFNLGDEILRFQPAQVETAQRPDLSSDLYLVYRGAVRLLCQEHTHNRKVTAALLEAGDTFGLDYFFCGSPLPYWAIAATPCQIARISAQKLISLLNHMPQLRKQIAQQEQQHEQLIFFKSLTNLSLVSSQQLKRMLLPHLMQQQVAAGALLKEMAAETSGHFWLRSGIVISQEQTAPRIGDSWGCLGRSPTDWIAHTNLVLYKLPIEHLKAAQVLNLL